MVNELLIIGTGHSESIYRNNASALIRNNQGNLLIDCGHTAKQALHEHGMTIGEIDSIFITHVHGDHVFGLERFAYESKFKHNKKIDLIFKVELYEELWEQTLKGSLGKIGEGSATFSDFFNLIILEGDVFTANGLDYNVFPVTHTPGKPAYGINISESVLYTGDTTAIPDTLSSKQFHYCIHDATLSEFNPVHATPDSMIESYPESLRKKIILTSYDDSWPQWEDSINKHFIGLARQGTRIVFDDEDALLCL